MVVQLVKNPRARRVDLDWKDSPGKGNDDLFQYSGLENSGPGPTQSMGSQITGHYWATFTFLGLPLWFSW